MTINTIDIPLARPDVTDAEIEAVVSVLRTPILSLGPKLAEFEQAMADVCQTRHAIAVCSGTAALHVVVRSMGIGPGDEVITTPFSFVASTNCMLFEGATPVFADIDPETWNIDPAAIEAAITDKTKAILPVDVFGQPANYDAITAIAKKHKLRVIEDSCEALGSTWHGRPAGSLGDAGVFGFYPNKQITTGEGGMVVTSDDDLAQMCRSLRNQGRDTHGGWLSHPRMGYNYRLSDINCALGAVQVSRLDEIIAKRREVAEWYLSELRGETRLSTQRMVDDVSMSWFVFVVRLDDRYSRDDRDNILRQLRDQGIGCSNYFAPIHLQPYMVEQFGFKPGDFPHCEAVADRTIALPFHKEMTPELVKTVCDSLRKLL